MKCLLLFGFLARLVVVESYFSESIDPNAWKNFLEALLNRGHPKPKNPQTRNLQTEKSTPVLADSFGGEPGFYHGVASGDPMEDRVILWTKYTPVSADEIVILELRMAEVTPAIPLEDHLDPDKNEYMWTKTIQVTPDTDFIAKIDVTGLDSNKQYVYAFTDYNVASDVGQTRTAPSVDDSVEEMKYCVFSCSNFGSGYFHPYDVCSTMDNLDFWIHVGDYIYENGYDGGGFGNPVSERENVALPQWEIVDLQDYRNRYATHHRYDEGLRNIRRRAPVIAIWDDHEFANNAYGKDSIIGAQNHDEICEDDEESCRPEGKAIDRFNMASQAYLEWMPIRLSSAAHPHLNISSVTQVIEWGSLATVLAVDSRLSARSKEPTLSNSISAFEDLLVNDTDVDAYYNESSPARQKIDALADAVFANMTSSNYTMLGENLRNTIFDTFQNSKEAGKTWQIFAQQVVMGNQLVPNFHKLPDFAPESDKEYLENFIASQLQNPSFGAAIRGLVAMAIKKLPLNSDSWDGFAHERAILLEGLRSRTNNAIILGGDSHDSWAYTLYEDGYLGGEKVAANLNAPAVTSSGYGEVLGFLFLFAVSALGGIENLLVIVEDVLLDGNSGLLYAELKRKGFIAVTATKQKHVSEYILMDSDTLKADYPAAREASGTITASFECDMSFVTTAGEPGSLTPQDECEATFYSERPKEWSIPVPVSGGASRCPGDERLSACDYSACELDTSEFPRAPEVASSGNLRSVVSAAISACFLSFFVV